MVKRNQQSRRPKPRVAYENQTSAKQNILAKLGAISSLLKQFSSKLALIDSPAHESAPKALHHLPRSVRQFNLWKSADLEEPAKSLFPNFSSNANNTLHELQLLEDVRQAVSAVKAFHVQEHIPDGAQKAAALKGRASLAIRLREIAESEVISLKRENRVLKSEIATLTLRLNELTRRGK